MRSQFLPRRNHDLNVLKEQSFYVNIQANRLYETYESHDCTVEIGVTGSY
jgi:hypothetical protein